MEANLIKSFNGESFIVENQEFIRVKMHEKLFIVQKELIYPCVFKEKNGKNGGSYFVFRNPVNSKETADSYLIEFFSGGRQDHRIDYGYFSIDEENSYNYKIIADKYYSWGDQHYLIVCLKECGYVCVKGNHGAGFKSKHPQPDFYYKYFIEENILKSISLCDPKIDIF